MNLRKMTRLYQSTRKDERAYLQKVLYQLEETPKRS